MLIDRGIDVIFSISVRTWIDFRVDHSSIFSFHHVWVANVTKKNNAAEDDNER